MTLNFHVFRVPGLVAVALFTLVSPFRTAQAQLGNDYVRIEVKVEADTDKKSNKPAGTPAGGQAAVATTAQERTLGIMLSGKPREPETRKGKWTIYSKGVGKDKDVLVVDSAEFKLELPSSGQQKVESKKATLTFTPAHYVGAAGKGKKVEAAGNKYYGYSIIIKDGETVVAEAYDPPGLKQELVRK